MEETAWGRPSLRALARTLEAEAWLAAELHGPADAPLAEEEEEEALLAAAAALPGAPPAEAAPALKRRRLASGAEDLARERARRASPQAARGLSLARAPAAGAWTRLLREWALPRLERAPPQLLAGFLDAFAGLRPPAALAPWVLAEAVAVLAASVHPDCRADGAHIVLALLKDLGDAMMKKLDVTNPKRPGAQKTRQARVLVHGSPGSATATLAGTPELPRALGELRPAPPMEAALHMLARALLPPGAAGPLAFAQAEAAALGAKEPLLQAASGLEGAGFPPEESLLGAAAFAAESVARSRADVCLALRALEAWGWREAQAAEVDALRRQAQARGEDAADLAETLAELRSALPWGALRAKAAARGAAALRRGHWHQVCRARPASPAEALGRGSRVRLRLQSGREAEGEVAEDTGDVVHIREHISGRSHVWRPRTPGAAPLAVVWCEAEADATQDAERPQEQPGAEDVEEELPLVQTGAEVGEIVRGRDGGRFRVLTARVAASAAACAEQGLTPLRAAEARAHPSRRLGQTCDHTDGGGCPCAAAEVEDLRSGRRGTWRELELPALRDCSLERPAWAWEVSSEPSSTARLLQESPGRLALRPRATARRLCRALAVPRDVLSDAERRGWRTARRALEAELQGLSPALARRLADLSPEGALAYWRSEQFKLARGDPVASGLPPPPLPDELASLVSEVRCPRPGCPGALLEQERFVRAVDEESLVVLRCCRCRYEARKA